MVSPVPRRPARRWWRPRNALPRSRPALLLGGLVLVTLVVLVLLGLTRARPGHQVPAYDPASTVTTVVLERPLPPPITATPKVVTSASTVGRSPLRTATTRKGRR